MKASQAMCSKARCEGRAAGFKTQTCSVFRKKKDRVLRVGIRNVSLAPSLPFDCGHRCRQGPRREDQAEAVPPLSPGGRGERQVPRLAQHCQWECVHPGHEEVEGLPSQSWGFSSFIMVDIRGQPMGRGLEMGPCRGGTGLPWFSLPAFAPRLCHLMGMGWAGYLPSEPQLLPP